MLIFGEMACTLPSPSRTFILPGSADRVVYGALGSSMGGQSCGGLMTGLLTIGKTFGLLLLIAKTGSYCGVGIVPSQAVRPLAQFGGMD